MDEDENRVLIEGLGSQNTKTRKWSAYILTACCIEKREWDKIKELLNHEDDAIRQVTVRAISEARGKDILPIISAIGKELLEENRDLRYCVQKSIYKAMDEKDDISDMINVVADLLKIKLKVPRIDDHMFTISALETLVTHYLNKKELDKIEELVEQHNSDAIRAISAVAEKGTDITPLIPLLINELQNGESFTRTMAAGALSYHYINKGDWRGIEKLTEHKNDNIRGEAAKAVIKKSDTLPGEKVKIKIGCLLLLGKTEELVEMGEDIIPILGKFVSDGVPNIKHSCIETLKKFAENGSNISSAIDGLGDALNDEDWWIRRDAAAAIKRLGFDRIPEDKKIKIKTMALLILLEEHDMEDLTALNEMGWEIAPVLKECLVHPGSEVRKNAWYIFHNLIANIIVTKSIVEKDYIGALTLIKENTQSIIGIYREKREFARERREIIRNIANWTEKVRNEMNPLDKKEPMKWKKPQVKKTDMAQRIVYK